MENEKLILGLLVVALLVSVVVGFVVLTQPKTPTAKEIASEVKVPSVPSADEIVAKMPTVPTAEEIASKIVIPQQVQTDSEGTVVSAGSSADRLCYLTNDCSRCFDFDYDGSKIVQTKISSNDYRKLKIAIEEITNVEKDGYETFTVEEKDSSNVASTCKEGDKGNFNVQILYRISYLPVDSVSTDAKVIYVLVKADVKDNVDVDNISGEKVTRKFVIEK